MHMFSREARIELEDGILWYIVEGTYKNCSMDVIKINERGESWTRNIQHFGWYGWRMGVPGEKEPDHYNYGYKVGGGFHWDVDPWHRENKWVGLGVTGGEVTESEISLILNKYPKFKWLLAKTKIRSRSFLFRMLSNWSKNALATESLIEIGCSNIAMDGRMPRLRDPKMVMKFINEHEGERDFGLNEIFGVRKYGCSIEDYQDWRSFVSSNRWGGKMSYLEYRYCKENNVTTGEYKDYRGMVGTAGHDFSDAYWHYPKNFKRLHDRVMRECEAIRKAKEAAEAEKQKKQLAKAERKYVKVASKYAKMVMYRDGLKFYVPQKVQDYIDQAEALKQCLVACNYMQKMTERKDKHIMVFVSKGGKPWATAELLKYRGKEYTIGQFNRSQRDINHHADAHEISLLKAWCHKFGFPIKETA